MKRIYLLVSLVMVASIVLAACGGAAATSAPTQPSASTGVPATGPTEAPATQAATEAATSAPTGSKSITIAYSQEPNNLVSEYSDMTYAAWIAQIIGANLATWDNTDTYVPVLATEIPTTDNGGISADGKTITWHLKPGLKWSDGEPITSKDVAFLWKSQVDPANAPFTRAGWDHITGVDTPDDTTAVVHFSSVYAPWQGLFATAAQGAAGQLLPSHILEGKTGLEKDPEIHQPTVVDGPYMVKEWVAGDHLTLVPNPNWSGNKPKLDTINIKFVPDPETALAALKTGDIDFNPDFTESDIPSIQDLEPNVHLRVDQTPSFEHLFFNLGITNSTIKDSSGKVIGNSDQPGFCPFQDVNVRKAFMLATDRDTIAKTLLFGQVTVPASLWPNSPWYNSSLTPYPYDPDQANQLLDTAGYPKGSDGIRAGKCNGQDVKFSLGVETTNKQVRVDTMNALADMYTKIGVELKPNPLPAGTFFGSYSEGADLKTGKYDLAIYTTGFYPDPDPQLSFSCTGVASKDNQSGQNDYHYCDQTGKLDQLIEQGVASADPTVRKPVYDEIQKYQYDNVLFIPLYARANVYGYTDRLNFPKSSADCGWACNITDWDVK